MQYIWLRVLVPALLVTVSSAQRSTSAISFETRYGFLLVVQASAGPLVLSCVLDTGASKTMVDQRVARKLGLKGRHRKAVNLDREIAVGWDKLERLTLGALEVRDFPVMIGDLRKFSEFANGLDAVIGMDLLTMSNAMQIDFGTRTILIQPRASELQRLAPQAMVVELDVEGGPMHLVLDSGLDGMFLYEDRLQSHEVKPAFQHILKAHQSRMDGRSAILPAVQFGKKSEDAKVFLIAHAPKDLPNSVDGYVGLNALHAEWVELDFAQHRIRWR